MYVFSLSTAYGTACPAGPNPTLKVGKAGPNTKARFCYQHYNPASACSNLARRLVAERLLWSYLGIEHLEIHNVKDWACQYLERHNIFIVGQPGLEGAVERYVQGRLGPVFEGG